MRCQTFYFYFFPCSADHERDWPPCKVVFFGLATNALNVRNNNKIFQVSRVCCNFDAFSFIDSIICIVYLLRSSNYNGLYPFFDHVIIIVLSLQSPYTYFHKKMYNEGLDVFRFFFKQ